MKKIKSQTELNMNNKDTQEKNNEFLAPFSEETKLIHFDSIDSTNNWAKSNPDQWAKKGLTLITASGQTAGRGRFTRKWVSPPFLNIYATFCFWVDASRQDIGHIPQLLALVGAQTLKEKNFDPSLKWPNDILINQKKVAGILCETILYENLRGIVCGIGLNVNMPKEILEQIDRPATSLLVEHGQEENPQEILNVIHTKFLKALQIFLQADFSSFFPSYCALSCLKKNQPVLFHDNQELIEARFDALLPNGTIRLILSNGLSKIYYAGEFIQ